LIGDLVTGPTDWPNSYTMQKTARCSFDWWTVAYEHSWSPEALRHDLKNPERSAFRNDGAGIGAPGPYCL